MKRFIERIKNWIHQITAPQDELILLPYLPQDICPHTDWVPETRENGWRSYCIRCLKPAAGSCQG